MVRKVFEIGSEYDWNSNLLFLLEYENDFWKNVSKQNVRFLRSGRDAIRYVAKLCGEKVQTVLMPALACSCMSESFVEEGYNVVYYKVRADFSVDLEDIEKKLSANSIFLFMNYFGQLAITDKEAEIIRNKAENIIFVEDITHDLLKRRNEIFQCDFTVCSIRKWFAIPDGGMVIGREPLEMLQVEEDTYFADLRENAMKLKSTYLSSGVISQKEEYRNVLAISNEYIDRAVNIADIQECSMRILSHINMKKIYELRMNNVKVLKEGIMLFSEIEPLIDSCEESTLYYPIRVKGEQSELQRVLADRSIYLPVIWPLSRNAEGVCGVADNVARSMLAIPCDHRYTTDDMKTIMEILSGCVK